MDRITMATCRKRTRNAVVHDQSSPDPSRCKRLAQSNETWQIVLKLECLQRLIEILRLEPAIYAHGLANEVEAKRVVGHGLIAGDNERIDERRAAIFQRLICVFRFPRFSRYAASRPERKERSAIRLFRRPLRRLN